MFGLKFISQVMGHWDTSQASRGFALMTSQIEFAETCKRAPSVQDSTPWTCTWCPTAPYSGPRWYRDVWSVPQMIIQTASLSLSKGQWHMTSFLPPSAMRHSLFNSIQFKWLYLSVSNFICVKAPVCTQITYIITEHNNKPLNNVRTSIGFSQAPQS